MPLLIKNVTVLTLDAAGTILENANVAIAGRTICGLGEAPPGFEPDEVIDGYNHLAVPGFFNAHCHSPMTFERGWAEDLPLERWFNERIWVAESALTSDDVYWGAALAACEMIRGGCVGFNDHYFYMDRVAEVAAEAGLKASLTWCQFGLGGDKEVGADLAGSLAFVDRWQGAADGRIRTVLGPHSPYVCPPAFLREVSALAREHNLPLHIHLAESPEQVQNSLAAHGLTPTAHLAACGVFDGPCIAAHALCLTPDDVALLAEHGVSVAHCPITYMKLAMGVNDLGPLLAAGVNVALGTDGPGSNNDMDMKAVVRTAALLQKYHTQNAEALAGDLPLRLATANGARAMGFGESGELAVGRAADLVLFDLDRPHLYPRHNLVANLVHAARGSDVTHVIVDGRLIYRDGDILTLDEAKIMAQADRRARRMVSQKLRIVREYKG
ncbi:MAG: amidohydrolase [Anaerolineales bacterium]|nr:amidohydrolase [Anaerolineales bacterium]